jgi:hypothetical protein
MQYSGAAHAFLIVATLTLMPVADSAEPWLDFSRVEIAQKFRVINDDVMGGVSVSRLSSAGDAMVFEGEVSLENNGGFASFRGPVRFPPESAALLLAVRGDGQRYKPTLKLDDSAGSNQYQAAFVAPREWQTLRFEPVDFTASFRGRAVTAPIVRFVDVRYFGLLISDKQSGAFRVEVKSITTD